MLKWLEQLLNAAEVAEVLVAPDQTGVPAVPPDGIPPPLDVQLAWRRRRIADYESGIIGLIVFIAALLGVVLTPFALRVGISAEVTVGTGVAAGSVLVWARRAVICRLAERLARVERPARS
jgi:predicted anti-sigma-YlaC factor YlaD